MPKADFSLTGSLGFEIDKESILGAVKAASKILEESMDGAGSDKAVEKITQGITESLKTYEKNAKKASKGVSQLYVSQLGSLTEVKKGLEYIQEINKDNKNFKFDSLGLEFDGKKLEGSFAQISSIIDTNIKDLRQKLLTNKFENPISQVISDFGTVNISKSFNTLKNNISGEIEIIQSLLSKGKLDGAVERYNQTVSQITSLAAFKMGETGLEVFDPKSLKTVFTQMEKLVLNDGTKLVDYLKTTKESVSSEISNITSLIVSEINQNLSNGALEGFQSEIANQIKKVFTDTEQFVLQSNIKIKINTSIGADDKLEIQRQILEKRKQYDEIYKSESFKNALEYGNFDFKEDLSYKANFENLTSLLLLLDDIKTLGGEIPKTLNSIRELFSNAIANQKLKSEWLVDTPSIYDQIYNITNNGEIKYNELEIKELNELLDLYDKLISAAQKYAVSTGEYTANVINSKDFAYDSELEEETLNEVISKRRQIAEELAKVGVPLDGSKTNAITVRYKIDNKSTGSGYGNGSGSGVGNGDGNGTGSNNVDSNANNGGNNGNGMTSADAQLLTQLITSSASDIKSTISTESANIVNAINSKDIKIPEDPNKNKELIPQVLLDALNKFADATPTLSNIPSSMKEAIDNLKSVGDKLTETAEKGKTFNLTSKQYQGLIDAINNEEGIQGALKDNTLKLKDNTTKIESNTTALNNLTTQVQTLAQSGIKVSGERGGGGGGQPKTKQGYTSQELDLAISKLTEVQKPDNQLKLADISGYAKNIVQLGNNVIRISENMSDEISKEQLTTVDEIRNTVLKFSNIVNDFDNFKTLFTNVRTLIQEFATAYGKQTNPNDEKGRLNYYNSVVELADKVSTALAAFKQYGLDYKFNGNVQKTNAKGQVKTKNITDDATRNDLRNEYVESAKLYKEIADIETQWLNISAQIKTDIEQVKSNIEVIKQGKNPTEYIQKSGSYGSTYIPKPLNSNQKGVYIDRSKYEDLYKIGSQEQSDLFKEFISGIEAQIKKKNSIGQSDLFSKFKTLFRENVLDRYQFEKLIDNLISEYKGKSDKLPLEFMKRIGYSGVQNKNGNVVLYDLKKELMANPVADSKVEILDILKKYLSNPEDEKSVTLIEELIANLRQSDNSRVKISEVFNQIESELYDLGTALKNLIAIIDSTLKTSKEGTITSASLKLISEQINNGFPQYDISFLLQRVKTALSTNDIERQQSLYVEMSNMMEHFKRIGTDVLNGDIKNSRVTTTNAEGQEVKTTLLKLVELSLQRLQPEFDKLLTSLATKSALNGLTTLLDEKLERATDAYELAQEKQKELAKAQQNLTTQSEKLAQSETALSEQQLSLATTEQSLATAQQELALQQLELAQLEVQLALDENDSQNEHDDTPQKPLEIAGLSDNTTATNNLTAQITTLIALIGLQVRSGGKVEKEGSILKFDTWITSFTDLLREANESKYYNKYKDTALKGNANKLDFEQLNTILETTFEKLGINKNAKNSDEIISELIKSSYIEILNLVKNSDDSILSNGQKDLLTISKISTLFNNLGYNLKQLGVKGYKNESHKNNEEFALSKEFAQSLVAFYKTINGIKDNIDNDIAKENEAIVARNAEIEKQNKNVTLADTINELKAQIEFLLGKLTVISEQGITAKIPEDTKLKADIDAEQIQSFADNILNILNSVGNIFNYIKQKNTEPISKQVYADLLAVTKNAYKLNKVRNNDLKLDTSILNDVLKASNPNQYQLLKEQLKYSKSMTSEQLGKALMDLGLDEFGMQIKQAKNNIVNVNFDLLKMTQAVDAYTVQTEQATEIEDTIISMLDKIVMVLTADAQSMTSLGGMKNDLLGYTKSLKKGEEATVSGFKDYLKGAGGFAKDILKANGSLTTFTNNLKRLNLDNFGVKIDEKSGKLLIDFDRIDLALKTTAPHLDQWTSTIKSINRQGFNNEDLTNNVLVQVLTALKSIDFSQISQLLSNGFTQISQTLNTSETQILDVLSKSTLDLIVNIGRVRGKIKDHDYNSKINSIITLLSELSKALGVSSESGSPKKNKTSDNNEQSLVSALTQIGNNSQGLPNAIQENTKALGENTQALRLLVGDAKKATDNIPNVNIKVGISNNQIEAIKKQVDDIKTTLEKIKPIKTFDLTNGANMASRIEKIKKQLLSITKISINVFGSTKLADGENIKKALKTITDSANTLSALFKLVNDSIILLNSQKLTLGFTDADVELLKNVQLLQKLVSGKAQKMGDNIQPVTFINPSDATNVNNVYNTIESIKRISKDLVVKVTIDGSTTNNIKTLIESLNDIKSKVTDVNKNKVDVIGNGQSTKINNLATAIGDVAKNYSGTLASLGMLLERIKPVQLIDISQINSLHLALNLLNQVIEQRNKISNNKLISFISSNQKQAFENALESLDKIDKFEIKEKSININIPKEKVDSVNSRIKTIKELLKNIGAINIELSTGSDKSNLQSKIDAVKKQIKQIPLSYKIAVNVVKGSLTKDINSINKIINTIPKEKTLDFKFNDKNGSTKELLNSINQITDGFAKLAKLFDTTAKSGIKIDTKALDSVNTKLKSLNNIEFSKLDNALKSISDKTKVAITEINSVLAQAKAINGVKIQGVDKQTKNTISQISDKINAIPENKNIAFNVQNVDTVKNNISSILTDINNIPKEVEIKFGVKTPEAIKNINDVVNAYTKLVNSFNNTVKNGIKINTSDTIAELQNSLNSINNTSFTKLEYALGRLRTKADENAAAVSGVKELINRINKIKIKPVDAKALADFKNLSFAINKLPSDGKKISVDLEINEGFNQALERINEVKSSLSSIGQKHYISFGIKDNDDNFTKTMTTMQSTIKNYSNATAEFAKVANGSIATSAEQVVKMISSISGVDVDDLRNKLSNIEEVSTAFGKSFREKFGDIKFPTISDKSVENIGKFNEQLNKIDLSRLTSVNENLKPIIESIQIIKTPVVIPITLKNTDGLQATLKQIADLITNVQTATQAIVNSNLFGDTISGGLKIDTNGIDKLLDLSMMSEEFKLVGAAFKNLFNKSTTELAEAILRLIDQRPQLQAMAIALANVPTISNSVEKLAQLDFSNFAKLALALRYLKENPDIKPITVSPEFAKSLSILKAALHQFGEKSGEQIQKAMKPFESLLDIVSRLAEKMNEIKTLFADKDIASATKSLAAALASELKAKNGSGAKKDNALAKAQNSKENAAMASSMYVSREQMELVAKMYDELILKLNQPSLSRDNWAINQLKSDIDSTIKSMRQYYKISSKVELAQEKALSIALDTTGKYSDEQKAQFEDLFNRLSGSKSTTLGIQNAISLLHEATNAFAELEQKETELAQALTQGAEAVNSWGSSKLSSGISTVNAALTKVTNALKTLNSLKENNRANPIFGENEIKEIDSHISKLTELQNSLQDLISNKNTSGLTSFEEYQNTIALTNATITKLNDIKLSENVSTQVANLKSQYDALSVSVQSYMDKNTKMKDSPELVGQFKQLINNIQETGRSSSATKSQLKQLVAQFNALKLSVANKGLTGRSLKDDIGYIAQKLGIKAMLGNSIYRVIGYFKSLFTTVKELDTQMTALKRVTNETEQTYTSFLKNTTKYAKQLGATMSDVVSATTSFVKLGYELQDAQTLASNAIIYKTVGDMDIETATNDMISAMKAFDLTAQQSEHIVDTFDILNNKYAVTAAQVGEGLSNSAALLATANNSFEQSAATYRG